MPIPAAVADSSAMSMETSSFANEKEKEDEESVADRSAAAGVVGVAMESEAVTWWDGCVNVGALDLRDNGG